MASLADKDLEINNLKERLKQSMALRQEERKGRTQAEQKNRLLLLDKVRKTLVRA